MCGQVAVKHLYISQIGTLEVPVIYRNCHGMIIDSACSVILRIRDSTDHDITGAKISVSGDRHESLAPDDWGRVFLGIRFGSRADVRVTAEGFAPQDRRLECSADNPRIEETIRLEPVPK
jgi:hypothetical protein